MCIVSKGQIARTEALGHQSGYLPLEAGMPSCRGNTAHTNDCHQAPLSSSHHQMSLGTRSMHRNSQDAYAKHTRHLWVPFAHRVPQMRTLNAPRYWTLLCAEYLEARATPASLEKRCCCAKHSLDTGCAMQCIKHFICQKSCPMPTWCKQHGTYKPTCPLQTYSAPHPQ